MRRAARTEPGGPSSFTGPEGGFGHPEEKTAAATARARGGIPPVGSPPPARSLLAGSHAVQALLVAEHQEPSLVREQAVPLHLVDQRRNERARRADEVGQILLRDPVQAELVSGSDPLAVRLRERDQHLREPGRNVLPGEAEDALAQLADALVQRADDVDRQRRARLEQRAEVAPFDAPDFALAGGDGQVLHHRAFRTQDLAEEIARLEDREDG